MQGSGAPHARVVGNENHQKNSSTCFIRKQNLLRTTVRRGRERARSPLAPRLPRGVGEQRAPRSRRRKRNFRSNGRGRICAIFKKLRPSVPSETNFPAKAVLGERERARSPLAPHLPRGCRGAERPTPRVVGNQDHQKNSSFRREPISQKNSPRESSRGSQPSRTRHPRGCRGAERPTPASSETKPSKEQFHLLHQKTKPHQNNLPQRARNGAQPSRIRHPRGCRGAERPTLVSSETTSTKDQPASSGTKISTKTAPGELERV